MVRAVLLICCLSIGTPNSSGAIFHVARAEIGADNGNDGLSATKTDARRGPWLSISFAAARSQAGDTILVHDGDYRDENVGWGKGVIPLTQSGRPDAIITFRAAEGSKPRVFRFLAKGQSWISIHGFMFENPDFTLPRNWKIMPTIVIDQPAIAIDPSQPWNERQERVQAKYASFFQLTQGLQYESGIELERCSHFHIEHNEISGYWAGIQCRDRSTKIRIVGNSISRCVNGIYTWRPAPSLVDSAIEDNRLEHNYENGIDVREGAKNVTIARNQIQHSGFSHISVMNGTQHCVVRGNVVRHGGFYSEAMQSPGSSAISIHSSLDGIVVDGNFAAYQVDATGIDGNGFILDLMTSGHSVLFMNNISWRNGGDGINLTASPNAQLFNNAFVENGYQSRTHRRGAGVRFSRSQDVNNSIVNNLMMRNHAAGILGNGHIDKQVVVNNNFYVTHGEPLIWDAFNSGEKEFHSIEQIRKATRHEKNGSEGDPMVMETHLFAPLAESPLVGRGLSLKEVMSDHRGFPRPSSAPTIGPIEFRPPGAPAESGRRRRERTN